MKDVVRFLSSSTNQEFLNIIVIVAPKCEWQNHPVERCPDHRFVRPGPNVHNEECAAYNSLSTGEQ